MTPAQIALAWILNKKSWIVPIPETRKVSRLSENISAATLSESEMKRLDDALQKIEGIGKEVDGRTRHMALLATLLGCQGIDEFRCMLPAAMNFVKNWLRHEDRYGRQEAGKCGSHRQDHE